MVGLGRDGEWSRVGWGGAWRWRGPVLHALLARRSRLAYLRVQVIVINIPASRVGSVIGSRGAVIQAPTTHQHLPTTHSFLLYLTTYYSLLTIDDHSHSLLATRYLPLATCHSLLATRCSLLVTHYSLLTTHYSLLILTDDDSLLTAHNSLLTICYWLPGAPSRKWRDDRSAERPPKGIGGRHSDSERLS